MSHEMYNFYLNCCSFEKSALTFADHLASTLPTFSFEVFEEIP